MHIGELGGIVGARVRNRWRWFCQFLSGNRQRCITDESSGCDFLAHACWRHGMLMRSESFFLVGEDGQKSEHRRTNSKLTRRLVQLLITKTHLFSLIPHSFLHYPTTSRGVLYLAQIDAIPPNVLPWRISRFVKDMGKQTPEAFASRAWVCRLWVGPSRGWLEVRFTIWRKWRRRLVEQLGLRYSWRVWTSSARSRAAWVSSVTIYTDGRDELKVSRSVGSISSFSSLQRGKARHGSRSTREIVM